MTFFITSSHYFIISPSQNAPAPEKRISVKDRNQFLFGFAKN
ncbi:MAG: hypothetical protein ABIK84_00670 [candidate division WOR-3 bacterium]